MVRWFHFLSALVATALCALYPATVAQAAHGLAWGGVPKYSAGFGQFDYVNPNAPRGGSLNRDAYPATSFDKFNPFTLKGVPASGLSTLMFETLGENSDDEPFSVYGLLAEDISLASDELSVTFKLNPKAKFWNGDPVLAADVKYSFDTLMSKQAHPRYRQYFGDVRQVTVVDERTVRVEFKQRNHELYLVFAAQLPVFSRKWGLDAKGVMTPFDKLLKDEPLTSGPYRIESFDFGKTVTYKRRGDYWANDLNVRKGMFNFERIVYKYYKDETARLEAFKAGEFDWMAENSAKQWARGHAGRKFDSGQLIRKEFEHGNPSGMQGFAMNTRRKLFQDVRVREALSLAMDFEWMNRQIFYGQYVRSPSYFSNSDMEATGVPSPQELALLEPYRKQLPEAVFGTAVMPPNTLAPDGLRVNLRKARELFSQAGWEIAEDSKLRNKAGEPFDFEVLMYSKTFERVVMPWVRNLEKLGVTVRLRTTDLTLFQKRADDFDFDVTIHSFTSGQTPGNELIERFSSAAADEKGTDNLPGIKNPVVDELVQRLLKSKSRDELRIYAKAIDRILRAGHYMVPHFSINRHRVSYSKKLNLPDKLPLYYAADSWMLKTWWMGSSAPAQK